MDDFQAYTMYPQHRKWFNKLYVAELFGYNCGPCGLAPQEDCLAVIRPIYNLSGMGVGARVENISAGDTSVTPPGYFWCEYLEGEQYSVDYTYDNERSVWVADSCWIGRNSKSDLSKFDYWSRSDYAPEAPTQLNDLAEIGKINIEYKGNSVIEVHLRQSADPKCDHFVPVWSSDSDDKVEQHLLQGYSFIESKEDADGFLENPRIGFLVK